MKSTLRKFAIAFGIAASIGATGAVQACSSGACQSGGMYYYDTVTRTGVYVGEGTSYYGSYYNTVYGRPCTIVPAHKFHGNYYPAQKVCYRGGYYNSTILCGWVRGHWVHHHKTWVTGHSVCWRY